MDMDRRIAMKAGLVIGLAGLSVAATAQTQPIYPVFMPRPLPFDPTTVPGLSAKLLISHHDNNYIGAVKRLVAIKAAFASLDPAKVPGFELN